MSGTHDPTSTSFERMGDFRVSASASTDQPLRSLPHGSVAKELFDHPWKFDFFEAVLLLQEFAARTNQVASAPIAGFALPREEALRFSVPNNNVFPAATIQTIQWDARQQRPHVCINFMGLTGPSGTLPRTYTERLQRIETTPRHAERDALRDWLDNFNHRLASLFFEAWSKYRFPVAIRRQFSESSFAKHPPTMVRVALSSIAGLAFEHGSTPHASDGTAPSTAGSHGTIDRDEMLGLAGVLSQRPMNVCNLQSALQQSLGVPIRIKQFEGTWMALDACSQTQLGIQNCRLGEDSVVGERIWTRQQKISIEVGPLGSDQFPDFLPPTDENTGQGLQRLRQLVGVCIGHTLEFDVQAVLRIEQPLTVQLVHNNTATRLGYDSWLGTPPNTSIADDAIFPGNP